MTHAVTCALRVSGTSPEGARVSVRRQQFAVGRPIEFDEASPRIAALEYAVGAVGAEVVGGLSGLARQRHVDIDDVEALVRCEVEHALVYLGVVGEHGQPRIARMHVKVFVSAADEPSVRRIWEELADRLPLVSTMRAACPLDLELVMTP